ncbi:MAG TPA: manganese efflux pump MntP family protein [Candidatus Gastranaerophilales bacterium]|nr:manganese efflux pump MntP family protein [Candidatus Gastranaerophilales bacterium]
MLFIEIIFLAVALSIDASVVSFSQGLIFTENKRKNSLYLAFWVGAFQALMPVIGWFLAKGIYNYVEKFDHWIAFAIFLILGIKFINDAFKTKETECAVPACLSLQCLLLLAIATSIDAMAAGATLFFAKVEILLPALIIGLVTFINSLIGFWSGYIFKRFPSKYLEITAGLILIGLGLKIVFDHIL